MSDIHLVMTGWRGTLLVAVGTALASTLILRVLLATGWAWWLATDIPNGRSLHTRPTPRVGGCSVVPVVLAAILLCAPRLWLIAAAAGGLAALSQIDDRRGLPARVRFAGHLAAVAVLLAVYPAAAPWYLVVVGFLMVWLINLYNFMDGADGLAGGMALFGFGAYALAAALAAPASTDLTLAATAVAGTAFGFLLLNFHPARLFLGDAGSIPLGFLAGAIGYWGWYRDIWWIGFPAMVFAPFIADASVTLSRRLLRGEKFWEAHREHYYQRLVWSGFGHARNALCWYAVMLAGAILAVLLLGCNMRLQWIFLVGWYGVVACFGLAIDIRWHRKQSDANQTNNNSPD
ncbi:MAG: glycosyltransferase family 4 protein [Burkholderia sp.]